jgi:hypothetical protein
MRELNRTFVYVSLILLSGCTYTFPKEELPNSGSADFSKVITIGNSITAGFANGALYDDGQANSFSSILAGQLAIITPTPFNQPDITSPLGYSGSLDDDTPMGRLILVNPENPLPAPIIPGNPFDDNYEGKKTELNNFGVPGMRLIDADVQGFANDNRYYKRFALDISIGSLIGDAVAANSSFFTFWLGNNDILGYASSGATGNPSGDGSNHDDLTSISLFESKYEPIINQLLSNGAKGVVANIGNITDIPFFNTVPYNLVSFDGNNPEDTLRIFNLNQAYEDYNASVTEAMNLGTITTEEAKLRKIEFTDGDNGVVIYDENLTELSGQEPIRMAHDGDLLTFFALIIYDHDLGEGPIGTETPMGDEYILTPEEQTIILERTEAFNKIIQQTINNHSESLALVDINSIFKEFAENGAIINGSGLTSSIFPPYGGFSLDGTHPNPRGAAFIANHFIEVINKKYSANIPLVNPNNYPGNEGPILP